MWKAVKRSGRHGGRRISAGIPRADGDVEILPAHHGDHRPASGNLAGIARRECGADVGATIGADAHQLIDFAILGTGMARSVSAAASVC